MFMPRGPRGGEVGHANDVLGSFKNPWSPVRNPIRYPSRELRCGVIIPAHLISI